MHSKIFTIVGLSSFAAMTMAQNYDEDTPFARGYGSDEADLGLYDALIARAIPSRPGSHSSGIPKSTIGTELRGIGSELRGIGRAIPHHESYQGIPRAPGGIFGPAIGRRSIDLDDLEYALYAREAANAPKSGVARSSSQPAKAGGAKSAGARGANQDGIGSLLGTGIKLFESLFKRDALAMALAEAEADPELDIWADELYGY